MSTLSILVVDDSVFFRKILSDILRSIPGVEVVGTASNGKIALERAESLKPDVITLDIEMPVVDGIETLRQLKSRNINTEVIMVSAISVAGATVTMEALGLGASDFITKPDGSNQQKNAENIRFQIEPILSALRFRKKTSTLARTEEKIAASIAPAAPAKAEEIPVLERYSSRKPQIVVIGASTGGPKALSTLIPMLPDDFNVPIVVVQHMPELFTATLAESLNLKSGLTVVEACNNQMMSPGNVYIAPGGKQLKISKAGNSRENILMVNDDPPENHCKPSVNYLFRSVAKVYTDRALGVILTGMGDDGTLGLRLMKRHDVRVIAQDKETSTIFGMPAEAISAGVVDVVLPLESIAKEIVCHVSAPSRSGVSQ